jgi:type I restriction enzyme S subunit
MKSIIVAIPTLTEQTAIANFLDRKTAQVDKAIAQKEQLIELLKERRQILIHEAVTQGLDKSVEMKDSGVEWIGEVPKHWEVKKLKYVAEINYGISPNEKSYNQEGIGTVLVNGPAEYSKSNFGYTRSIKWTTEPTKFAKKGDLLFCLRGSTTGRLNICHQDLAIGRGCASLRGKMNHSFFIKNVIALKDRIIETFQGSTFPSITSSELNNYSISVPPEKEQIEIADYIETQSQKIKTAISLKQQEIASLKEYKTVLIDAAVTGKVVVD